MTVCYNNYFVFISDISSILKETPTEYELSNLSFDISELGNLSFDIRYKWYDIRLSLQVCRNVLDDLRQNWRDNLLAIIGNFLTSQLSTINSEAMIKW